MDKLQRITDIVYDLLERDPFSRILIAGDFNHLLDNAKSNFKKMGLFPVLLDGVATHKDGKQLDNIFSN